MEQDCEVLCRQIPQRTGIARNAFVYPRLTAARVAVRPHTNSTFTNAKRQSVSAAKAVMMTGAAGNIPVARQNLVIK